MSVKKVKTNWMLLGKWIYFLEFNEHENDFTRIVCPFTLDECQ